MAPDPPDDGGSPEPRAPDAPNAPDAQKDPPPINGACKRSWLTPTLVFVCVGLSSLPSALFLSDSLSHESHMPSPANRGEEPALHPRPALATAARTPTTSKRRLLSCGGNDLYLAMPGVDCDNVCAVSAPGTSCDAAARE